MLARYVQNNHIDVRKFNTLKLGISKFHENKGKQMSLEEMVDYCKTLFSDRKFIDILAKFSIDDPKSVEEKQTKAAEEAEKEGPPTPYTIYISLEKVSLVHDVLTQLPLITSKDVNFSSELESLIQAKNPRKAGGALKSPMTTYLDRHDPRL